LRISFPHHPIIVLSEDDELDVAHVAIRQGIHDWIGKSDLTAAMLDRAIRRAIERHRIELDLRKRVRFSEKTRRRTRSQMHELQTRAKELDAANRELDDFVYVVSHDLKEPLRGIKAYCELFSEDYANRLDEAGLKRLDAVAGLCGRLEKQISDLMTYYRVGRMPPSETRVDLMEVVDGQIAAFRALLDKRQASIRVKGPLPHVHGHPVLLGLIIGNLISNGLKYNRSEKPAIEIGVAAERADTVYVRDNGIGIAPEHHQAIFDLFRRLHGRKEFEGTGAGLTIVRKIVESCGGKIWLESTPGEGTMFFFTLPSTARKPAKAPHWIGREAVSDQSSTAGRSDLPGPHAVH
jgi:light-regulated signal transduction histidine kinase (bacteriophytochrome)